MYLDFSDQVVLVTGASSGIGAAVARAFGGLGARTVLHYNRNADGARAVQQEIEASGGTADLVRADLGSGGACDEMVSSVQERHGVVDVLVNNAGDLVRRAPVAEVGEDEYRRTMDLNVASVFHTCRRVVPAMQERGSGSVVNLTSVAARTGGAGGSVVYATSKGAVSTFTRGLAREVAGTGVRVNAVAPGIIATPFHDRHTDAEQMKTMLGAIPMGRAGRPEECVGAVLFLSSPAMSGYVTGQVIEVNGGQLTP
jgi:3-oxoacyl-[acyl-carrier protein] reductase